VRDKAAETAAVRIAGVPPALSEKHHSVSGLLRTRPAKIISKL
jgi:hypothetical protein